MKDKDKWALAIGRFIQNFSAIEILSYAWIKELARDEILFDLARHQLSFNQRVNLIQQLTKREKIPKKLKKDCNQSWEIAAKMATIRDQVAHNPLVSSWKGEAGNRPPDFIGIPNIKKTVKGKGKSTMPITGYKAMQEGINLLRDLAQDLKGHFEEIKKLLEKKKEK